MNEKQMEMMAREHNMSAIDGEVAEEAAKKAADGAKSAYQKIEDAVVSGYNKSEDGVGGGYRKIDPGVEEGFAKGTDKCVEKLFAKEGESVEDAKKRLSGDQ